MATIEKSAYGTTPDGAEIELFTLSAARGMRAKIINYGAILVSLEAPDRDGHLDDVTLGCESLAEWIADTCYFGATAGRVANRLADASFALDGQSYTLAANNGPNHLHGGIVGFNKVVWTAEAVEGDAAVGVKLTYLSADGEEGYPGNLSVTVVYTVTDAGELKIEYTATTDKPTVVNLTHHSYWNLSGPAAGDILGHELTLHADRYTPVDDVQIPTGEVLPVAGTPMDFTSPHTIGERLGQVEGGYDHNYVLRDQSGQCAPAAEVYDPASGRVLEICTTEPGIQFYSGNFLDGSVTGRGGVVYQKHQGFCLETQHYPDSPNQPDFPPVTLRPGETYRHVTVHKFSTR